MRQPVPTQYRHLFVGSVFIVRKPNERGKFVKMCPAYALDEHGHDAIFDPDTPIKLIGRAKCSVIDYSE